ncbi:hypothetical protein HH304_05840 [Flammeovirgaceae bacterium KN852]|uniref:Uncharacterized protein n=2 Tax=Marinigracilibium pacificum TaxID=2729599 RepID=A0A848J0B0_9BACT|nr:hypothetical protein [Marinigracilibium pacificum]
MLQKKSIAKYLKYAIGEIVLVVIGILIAIQINAWQQLGKENELERKYLQNLVAELKQDSIGLTKNYLRLKDQARTKNKLLSMIKNGTEGDSIIQYFEYQWRPIPPYSSLKATYTEITSSAHLSIIKNDVLREKMIKYYNLYSALEKEEEFLLQTASQNVIIAISHRIPDMSDYTADDVMLLKEDSHLLNTIQLNGAYTRRDNYKSMIDECADLIRNLERYQSTL